MKKSLFSLFFVLVIQACNENTSSEQQEDISNNQDTSISESSQEENSEFEEIIEDPGFFVEPFHIEDFPQSWTQLEEREGNDNRIIYDYCMREIARIYFDPKKGDKWLVFAGYGHDTREWDVVDFDALKQTQGEASIVEGSFTGLSSFDTINVSFYWNIEEKYCTFEGFKYDYPYFVSEKNKSHYELVKENCNEIDH